VDEGGDERLGSTLHRGDCATRCASKESILKNELEVARLVGGRHASSGFMVRAAAPEGLARRGVDAPKDVFGEGLEGLEFDGGGRPK
jgi:hypothetical protein